MSLDFANIIRNIQDFPQKGVVFRDITPVLGSPEYFRTSIQSLKELLTGREFDLIAGPESRGFIFGAPLAYETGRGFVPVRKAGKLPGKTIRKSYALEYGSAEIEIHADAIEKGQKVVIIDDVLATGGTCAALCQMIEEAGGIVEACVFFIELESLGGRSRLQGRDVFSVVKYSV